MKRHIINGLLITSVFCGLSLLPHQFIAQEQTVGVSAQILSNQIPAGWKEVRRAGKKNKVVVQFEGEQYYTILLNNPEGISSWLIADSNGNLNISESAIYKKIAQTATIAYFAQDKDALQQIILTWLREMRQGNKNIRLHDNLEKAIGYVPNATLAGVEIISGGTFGSLPSLKVQLTRDLTGIITDYIAKSSKNCPSDDMRNCLKSLVEDKAGEERIEKLLYLYLEKSIFYLENALDTLRNNDSTWSYEEAERFSVYLREGFLRGDYALTFWKELQPKRWWQNLGKAFLPSIETAREIPLISEWVRDAVDSEGSVRRALDAAGRTYEEDALLYHKHIDSLYTEQGRRLLLRSLGEL